MHTTCARSLRWPYRGFSKHPTTNSQHPKTTVAIFHLSVKTISRTAGRSATAAAAYRSGVEITDERTGEIHDYRRKAGVESAELFLPDGAPEWASDRAKLWNAAEQSEKRKNSTVAREFEVALPAELTGDQRRELAHAFARELVKRHGFAVDVAIHAPGKDGDSKNHHAHILCSTRKLTAEGFTEKTRELDDRATGAAEVTHWREQWAALTNAALERSGHAVRVDHRSLEMQGIDREPAIHLGPSATAIERRGEVSEKTRNHQERQREAAGKVAAMVAIAQAQAKAAAEIKEKENDRIRAAALRALAKSRGAAGRALAFTVSDHAGISENLRAAGGDLGRAVQGTRRRVDERRYGRAVEAVRGQFERVGGVVQQVADRVGSVIRTVAAAARQVAQKIRLEQERKRAENPLGLDLRNPYHPDNIAKRAAQEAAAPAKPVPLAALERYDLVQAEKKRASAARLDAEIEASRAAPPPQPASAPVPFDAAAKKAQWDATIKAERALYIKELTAQAHAKAVAHVAEHQAHIDAKPLLLGRAKWEEQRLRFENRDASNSLEWQALKDGRYPFIAKDVEAVQKAVELRVRDKHPALAQAMPKVEAALLEARRQAEQAKAQERSEARELDKVLSAFKEHALRREMKASSYGDTGQQWNAIPEPLRKTIEDFNRLSKEARAVALEQIGRNPQTVETLTQQLGQVKKIDRGMGR
jgi:hypothetical protein